ncbi:TGS domain-containing protein, partial [Candidatus Gracilibacteria bacterium]|nr:TGS domain-containing protein [Candidatus Gracilibacteria bacterium]
NKVEAYVALGVVHSQFKSKKNRIKDYISAPKANGYQSIHTTVSDEDDFIFEIQIQTQQMYKYNMFGLASHTSYKGLSPNLELYPKWMKKLITQQKDAFSGERFIENIKPNSLKETIICTTPKGKEIELPRKATVLDFAFKVHSDIGKRSIGSWINNEYVDNLVYTLNDGDEVELELGREESNYPVRYLSFVRTAIAQKSLKTIFKKKSEHKRTLLGKHLLNERMELIGYKPFDSMPRLIKRKVLKEFSSEDKTGLYLELGSGNIEIDKIINYIYNLQQDSTKYKSTVSLKVIFKKKDHKNIHSLFDVFHNLNIQVINFQYKGTSSHIDIHVSDLNILHELLAELSRIPNVSIVKRTFNYRVWGFLTLLFIVSFFIIFAPAIIFYFAHNIENLPGAFKVLFYISIALFIGLLYSFKYIAKITLPGPLKQKAFWSGMFILNIFILASVLWGGLNIYDKIDSTFLLSVSMLLFGLTSFEYLSSKSIRES